MPDEKKPPRPEISFLPPLKMVLSFFNRDLKKCDWQEDIAEGQNGSNEKAVAKLIEKLNEKDS